MTSSRFFLLVAFVITHFFFLTDSRAQVLPSKEWKSVRIGRFELIYDTEHQALAELYAQRLERLEPLFSPVWKNIPRKTTVVLNDMTDLTNGYATFLPYPLVMLYPVLPGPMDTIGEYHDWAWELMVHEYTHILSFEQRRGVVNGLSYIFGNIMTPNALLPSWWLEGVAVEAETRYSSGGRLRSKLQEGSVRALVHTGELDKIELSHINEASIPSWPYGGRPYLFGSLLWSEMVAEQGEKVMGEIHDRLGGRAPFFINSPVSELFNGKDRLDLYRQMQQQVRQEARTQLQTLSTVPFSKTTTVDNDMLESFSPTLSPDHLKLAYVAKNAILRRRVQVLVRGKTDENFSTAHRISNFGKDWDADLPGGSPLPRRNHSDDDDAPPGGNITRISWHPNSNSFVFDQVLEKNRFEEYSDLWIFDLSKGKAEKITTDGRAREPSFSPDGKQIAYVRVEAGVTHLHIWDTEAKQSKAVFTSPLQARVSFPAWLDQDRLIFSIRQNGKESAIVRNIKTNEQKGVLADYVDPLYFQIEKDRILFTSTQNGVRNLYQTSLDFTKTKPITHSATHVLAGAFDPGTKSFYYGELTTQGWSLRTLLESETNTLESLPIIKPFWENRYPPRPFVTTTATVPPSEGAAVPTLGTLATAAIPSNGTVGTTTSLLNSAEDYSPYGYLWPRYWLPFIGWDSQGVQATISTSGSDPLAKHSYFLSAGYDSAIQRGNFLLTYYNQVYWPTYQLLAYDTTLRGTIPALDSRSQAGQLGAAWEIESISPDWFISLGWTAFRRSRLASESNQQGPFIGTTYHNTSQTAAQVSIESGWQGSLFFSRREVKELGRANSTTEGSLTTYWSKFLPKRHALMVKVLGRYSDSGLQIDDLEQTTAMPTTSSALVANYLMRGYPSGTFLGRQVINPIIEYRFPLSRLDVGPQTSPLYFSRLYGAVVADGLFFDGYAFETIDGVSTGYRSEFGRGVWDAGLEVKMDINLGYHIPLTIYGGLYWPLDLRYVKSDPQFMLGLLL